MNTIQYFNFGNSIAMFVAPYIIIVFIFSISQNEAAKILALFPTPSISHQVAFRPLILELLNRGHEIVLVTTDPMDVKGPISENLTQVDVHDMSYKTWNKQILEGDVTSGKKDDIHGQITSIYKALGYVFEKNLLTSEMQAILSDKSKTFDLLLIEAYYSPLIVLSYRYKVPVILMSSFMAVIANFENVGAPTHYFVYPMLVQQRFINLTYCEKIPEAYYTLKLINALEQEEEIAFASIKQIFGPGVPSLRDLRNNVDLLLSNVHPAWDSNRPVPPNVIYMGGIHQKPEKELPKDLKTYLDSSKNGVIYVSFGTNIEPSSLPSDKIQALIGAFSKVPYDVLLKWNQDELPGRTKNIRISKWLPQSDLLRHPKVKLFITQGGLQSTDEAITAGVPLIGIPMLGDQWYNVEHYVKHKIGLKFDMDTITEEKLRAAIQTVLKDQSYRDNILKLRSIMHDQPQTPLERAIWWTEHVLRHKGAKHLRSPAANMPWTVYYDVELVSYLLIGLIFLVISVTAVSYRLCSVFFGRSTGKVKTKKSLNSSITSLD